MTWPQAAHLGTRVYDNDDPLLSIWRLSWIAHILPKHPLEIFNGNIFHPEPRTLAYSDATLLQGLVTAPWIWAGGSNITAYNAILLLSIALSGWAMWRYAWYLTEHQAGALLAGIIFAFVPFRFDHYHHLELQATIFLPLTLLYFERALASGSRQDVWLMAAAFVAQVLSGIYYAIFLATVLVPTAIVRVWRAGAPARSAFLTGGIPAAAVALVIVLPYALTYLLNRGTLGERLDREVMLYSATLKNYVATTKDNVLHGASAVYGQPERYLFPGFAALVLAASGLHRMDWRRATLVAVAVGGFLISLGLNSPLYEPLRAVLLPYRGLRAPARASILLYLALAALAAFGWKRLMRGRSAPIVTAATVITAAVLLTEYRTRLDSWLTLPVRTPEVYTWLAQQPRLVVAEVPFARADALHAISDGLYMFHSTRHWQPIVNGYSGFFPKTFIELAEQTAHFPDDDSIAYLKQRGVDVIVVHEALLPPGSFGEMTVRLLARPDIEPIAQFQEARGTDAVFRLRP